MTEHGTVKHRFVNVGDEANSSQWRERVEEAWYEILVAQFTARECRMPGAQDKSLQPWESGEAIWCDQREALVRIRHVKFQYREFREVASPEDLLEEVETHRQSATDL